METQTNVSMIAPEAILADDNARYTLLDTRLEKLKEQILEAGQVNDPIEVEPIAEPTNGCSYRVTVGHYRHAAALALNKDSSAGLMLPTIIRQRADVKERLLRQVSENNDRQNLTPMDSAVAIKRMLEAGIARLDVRKAFARPNVKGKIVPASNSFLNMMVSFLDLPKKAQNMLHTGTLPVRKAYELTKASKDKQASILEEAIKDREKEFEFEDKLEQKFLDDERKAAEDEQKKLQAEAEALAAKQKADAILAQLNEKRQANIEIYQKANTASDADEKKKAQDALKAAEKNTQMLEKEYVAAAKIADKAEDKLKSATDVAKEKREKLAKAREAANAAKAAKKAAKPLDIEKATKKVEGKSSVPSLRANEIKDIIDQMSKPNGDAPKVEEIGKALYATFFGSPDATQLWTPTKLFSELRRITGEGKKAAKA